ncbi:MAG: PTS sugar transporter subunit IIA [Elusimicrobiota bacterium]|jgi:PTS system nitrogen regulatory IIA component|nr:PTS sugar transporter subunit IIA [Elusimicrobiota bacterium]
MPTEKTSTPVVLNKKRVFIVNDNISKKDLAVKLVSAICDDLPGSDREDIMNAVLKREQGISTTLDTGLSIPHARVEDLDSFQAAVAVLPKGITDDYGLQIKVMFLFLSPAGPVYFAKHLNMLALLAEKFNTQFIAGLCAAKDEEEILRQISF